METSPLAERQRQSGPSRTRKISCEECRRLKLRCNREWPCSECIRRGTSKLCPTGTSAHGLSKSAQITQLQARIAQLEVALQKRSVTDAASSAPAPPQYGKVQPFIGSPNTSTSPSSFHSAIPPTSIDSVGQLTWKKGGNTRFFGMTAADHRRVVLDDRDDTLRTMGGTGEASEPFLTHQDLEWPLVTVFPDPRTPTAADLMACLPSRGLAVELVNTYWDFTSWRFEPFTKVFLDEIFQEVYSTESNVPLPNPHRLALLFAIFALAALFHPLSISLGAASRYHGYTRSALAIGNFMNDVSVASLCTIHLICGYILNAELGMDELYVLVGLGLRMAMAAGYHKDGSWWNIDQPDLDHRRRIWWELTHLERIHSLGLGLPSTIPPGCDTARPSSLNPMSFFWWKWELQLLVNQSSEAMATSGDRSYDAILAADQSLRAYDAKLPEHLRCRTVPLWRLAPDAPHDQSKLSLTDYIEVPGLGDDGMPLQLRFQQIRLAQLYNHALLHLHRSSFTSSLLGEPTEGPFAPSVLAVVIESASNNMNLIWALYRIDPRIACYSTATNVLDLYNSLACVAALLIRRPSSPLKDHCVQHLELGMSLMNRMHAESPSVRVGKLYVNVKKLEEEAKASVHNVEAFQYSAISTAGTTRSMATGLQSAEAEPAGMAGMSNVDFDAWLSQFFSTDGAA